MEVFLGGDDVKPLSTGSPERELIRVLLIEDDRVTAEMLMEMLANVDEIQFVLEWVDRLSPGIERLAHGGIDLVLTDLGLPDSSGLDTFLTVHARAPEVPVVVLTATDDEKLAIKTVQSGAQDYWLKSEIESRLLVRSIRYALERVRADRILAEERQRLSALMQTIPDRIYFKDENCRFLQISHSMAKLIGLGDPSKAIGRQMYEFFTPEYARQSFEDDQRVLHSGEPMIGTVRHEDLPDGSVSWSHITKMPLRDGRGRIIGTFGITRDITDLKHAEEAVRKSEERYKELLASITDYIYTVHFHDGMVVSTVHGQGCLAVTGYDPRDFAAEPDLWYRMVHPDDRPAVVVSAAQLAAGSVPAPIEHRILHRDGSTRWVRNQRVLRYNPEGRLAGYDGLVSDITGRKLAEERIAQLNRARAILAAIDHAIVHIPDKRQLLDEICRVAVEEGGFKLAWIGVVGPDGFIQPVAKAGVTGYLDGIRVTARDEPEGRGPMGTSIRENRAVMSENIDEDSRMDPWHDRAGQFGLHYAAALPIRIKGKVTGALAVYAPRIGFFDENEVHLLAQVGDDISFALTAIEEITERQVAEERLQKSQLLLINAEKLEITGRLAAGVAHEVKNPLAILLMGLGYLSDSLPGVDGTIAGVMNDMRDAIWRADTIIRGMLDFSGSEKLELQRGDLNAAIEQAFLLVKHSRNLKHITLVTNLDPSLPPVAIDRNKVGQAFINLFSNSIDAMPDDGILAVRTYRKRLSKTESDPGSRTVERFRTDELVVVVEIDDTGSGIPPDKLSRIFDPFFTTKAPGKGTGIGLTVTRKIIELHGGSLVISNRHEGGVRSVLQFPAMDTK